MVSRTLALVVLAACGHVSFDSSRDAGADGPGPPYCATVSPPPTFCADFEDGSIGAFSMTHTDSGALVVEPAAAHASRFGIAASTEALATASPTADADAELDLATAVTTVTVGFDLEVATLGTSDPVLVELAMDDGAQTHTVEYVYRAAPATSYIEDVVEVDGSGNPSFNYFQLASATPDVWHRVGIEVTTGAGATCTVTHDGAIALQTPLVGTTGGALKFFIGGVYLSGPAQPWVVDLDNIVLDVQ